MKSKLNMPVIQYYPYIGKEVKSTQILIFHLHFCEFAHQILS